MSKAKKQRQKRERVYEQNEIRGRNCGKRKQRKNYGGNLPDILDLCAVRGGLSVPWAEAGKNGEGKPPAGHESVSGFHGDLPAGDGHRAAADAPAAGGRRGPKPCGAGAGCVLYGPEAAAVFPENEKYGDGREDLLGRVKGQPLTGAAGYDGRPDRKVMLPEKRFP